jgi:hypothetical protein
MQWEMSELNLQTVILLQFLDTPGDEVAPRSNKIGKNFENERFRHDRLLFSLSFLILLTSVPGSQRSGIGFDPISS